MDDKDFRAEIKQLIRKQKRRERKLQLKYHWKFITNKRIRLKHRLSYFFMQMLFRRCDGKGYRCDGGWAYFSRINTAYEDELSNYHFGCKTCHADINSYYDELWAEYNSGRI